LADSRGLNGQTKPHRARHLHKFITPALRNAGWDEMLQIREEFSFTKGRIIVCGKLVSRGRAKRALTCSLRHMRDR
jgi:type I site-specific restriction endonuclease